MILMNSSFSHFVFFLFLLSLRVAAESDLKFGGVFASNMVLQQQVKAPIWGTAEPGEAVALKCSWRGGAVRVKAGDDGVWRTVVETPKAGGPYEISAKGKSGKVEIDNVLVGEVWVCSGQSNMQWKMRGFGVDHFKEAVVKAKYPEIRLCTLPQVLSLEPRQEVEANWVLCSPQSVLNFSAVAYFFGSQLHQELDVPIGLISTNWGGSSAEAWIREETLREDFPEFKAALDEYPGIIEENGALYSRQKKAPKGLNHTSPSVLYNSMLKPLMPLAIRGVIWYQGETNVKRPEQYRTLFPTLIRDWREEWGQGDFPFYYVQIAPFIYKVEKKPAALLREAQAMALAEPNTGMVVTMDVGDETNIHPKDKQPVGERLARLALAKDYGQEDLVYSGPTYREMKKQGAQIWLKFEHLGGGLQSRDGEPLSHFTMAGRDRKFHPATATISKGYVIVESDEVKRPVAVRYGWGNADEPNLMNAEGLPASSFRTDDWEFEEK